MVVILLSSIRRTKNQVNHPTCSGKAAITHTFLSHLTGVIGKKRPWNHKARPISMPQRKTEATRGPMQN